MSQFSAAPQTLGYLNQVRYALVTLLENEECTLRLEALDDIDISGSNGDLKLLQLKHRAEGVVINDYSPDLWKSIRVWATQIIDGSIDVSNTIFNLITTATAESESAAAQLRNDSERDPTKALARLLEAAYESKNSSLAPSFRAFSDLSDSQRDQLVSRIFVLDEAPSIIEARSRIEGKLAFSVSRDHRVSHADSVEGWWLRVAIEILAGKRPPISGREVFDKIYSISQQFNPASLPIDCYLIRPSEAEQQVHFSRDFVSQLRRIDVTSARIQNAVLDYHRAFTQRARWVRDRLLIDEELDQYGDRLLDEWNRMRLVLEQRLPPEESDQALIDLGRELLAWAETAADIRIRSNVTEPYVMRGSFHMLADESPPRLKWHRNYGAILKAAIEQRAS